MSAASAVALPLSGFTPRHFLLSVANRVATVTLNRPQRKNPLTFASYAELRDTFLALDGVCAGAGAAIAMASDIQLATDRASVAFLFNRAGLAGCDMGACAMLPRIVGQGRAAELLYTGRSMKGPEAERWGFFNRLAAPETLLEEVEALARSLAEGPAFANAMTKRMLEMEWDMSVAQAIEAEAMAQAVCMQTEDVRRAFRAFANKEKPVFEGN